MRFARLSRGVSLAAIAFVCDASVVIAQESLPMIEIGAEQPASTADRRTAPRDSALDKPPVAQTTTKIDTSFLDSTPMSTLAEILQYSPGVHLLPLSTTQEAVISIRGSGDRPATNATRNYQTRNIRVYEDGFPVTTADGFTRLEYLDPHAYAGANVTRGPSSGLYGNYALFGALNMRSYTGAQIEGFEFGSEGGSFGYVNNFVRAGAHRSDPRYGEIDISLFGSDQRNDGYLPHNDNHADRVNLTARYAPNPADRFTLKAVFADTVVNLQGTETLAQYYNNPRQTGYGCPYVALAGNPFCVTRNATSTGAARNVAGSVYWPQSYQQFGAHSHREREMTGLRWEHDLDADTTLRTQFTYDFFNYLNGNIAPLASGPTGFAGPLGLRGPIVSIDAQTSVSRRGALFGLPATHTLGFVYNNTKTSNSLWGQIANYWGDGATNQLATKIDAFQSNIGLWAREEVELAERLTAVAGFSSNWAKVAGRVTNYFYAANGAPIAPGVTSADDAYWNTAPEAGLSYRYSPEWNVRARWAAGYGTPNFNSLTTTPYGSGDNSTLKAQTNMGVDVGVDWTPSEKIVVSVNGFNEWYRNETLTQTSPYVANLSYQTSVPSSIHRGAEVSIDLRPVEGWRLIAAYTYNDQFFTSFSDRLSTTIAFDRSGFRIPNVPAHTLTSRLAYEIPNGELKGLGAYVEYLYRSDYPMDNANTVWAPAYGLVNVGLNYKREVGWNSVKTIDVYFAVKNLFDRQYMAAAFPIADTMTGAALTPPALLANSGDIVPGSPRAFMGGVKVKF
jgi:iron complex outermembrane recepter protein